MMNKVILSGFLAAVSIFPAFAQEQAPSLDPQFGVKPFSDPDYVNPYTMKQSVDGGFYLGGEYGLIRLDAAGDRLWSVLYPTVESSGWLTAAEGNIAVDTDNNVYVCVNMYAAFGWEPHILKYSPQGNLLNDYVISVTLPDSDPALFGAAYSVKSQKVYAAFYYWSSYRDGYVTAIGMFDEDLNLIKTVEGPAGIDWDYGSVTGIGTDKDGNVYVGGSRTGSFIYVLKYDPWLNLLFEFAKDPAAPKMFIGGEVIPGGGYYIINNEFTDNTLHSISASGAEQWSLSSSMDIYIHTVDSGGNFYWVNNLNTPQFGKLGYGDGSVKWSMSEPQSAMINAIFADEQDRIYTAGYLADPVDEKDSYIARYAQGEAKYFITKSTGDEQIVLVSSMTEPMVSLVTISGTTNPANNIAVNFTVSTYPANSTGQMLTKSSETTNIQGLADVQLRLGDIPAEYGLTAICPSCETSASSVTFTCCGKLPNDHFSQSGVPEWSYDCYNGYTGDCGKNRTTIGWKGCALTTLTNLIDYYAREYPELNISATNPGALNNWLNKNDGYDENKDVKFGKIKYYTNGKVSYKARYDLKDSVKRSYIVNLLNSEILNKRPVIAVIKKEEGEFHYILVTGKCGDKYIISDPAGGKERLYDLDEVDYSLVGLRVFGRN